MYNTTEPDMNTLHEVACACSQVEFAKKLHFTFFTKFWTSNFCDYALATCKCSLLTALAFLHLSAADNDCWWLSEASGNPNMRRGRVCIWAARICKKLKSTFLQSPLGHMHTILSSSYSRACDSVRNALSAALALITIRCKFITARRDNKLR